jgi:hypothetical protein
MEPLTAPARVGEQKSSKGRRPNLFRRGLDLPRHNKDNGLNRGRTRWTSFAHYNLSIQRNIEVCGKVNAPESQRQILQMNNGRCGE